MTKQPIYLDNHATTRVDPRVVEAMLPFFTERYGNPSSAAHAWGWEAEEAVENARAQVARLVGARPDEIVFTSGATEADNLALQGVLEKYRAKRGQHLVTTALEHPAVLETARHLERRGDAELTVVGVGPSGIVDPADVEKALRPDTVLVSVMAANNEIGTLQPLAEVARIARARGVLVHTDAAQALARVPFDTGELGVDLASLSAHKMYGPKGVGALYVRKRVRVAAELHGGGHERGRRSGTLPVPNVVGFGVACALAADEMAAEAERIGALREHLRRRLTTELDQVTVHGDLERRLPGNLSVSFANVEGESLIMSLKRVALSAGSACSSRSTEPSHVLAAIGVAPELAHATLRFGIGRFNTAAEIDQVADELVAVVGRLRAMSPLGAVAAP